MTYPSYHVPLFQNESSCKTLRMKMNLVLNDSEPVEETQLHMNGFARRLFLTQTKGNSEMAFYNNIFL